MVDVEIRNIDQAVQRDEAAGRAQAQAFALLEGHGRALGCGRGRRRRGGRGGLLLLYVVELLLQRVKPRPLCRGGLFLRCDFGLQIGKLVSEYGACDCINGQNGRAQRGLFHACVS